MSLALNGHGALVSLNEKKHQCDSSIEMLDFLIFNTQCIQNQGRSEDPGIRGAPRIKKYKEKQKQKTNTQTKISKHIYQQFREICDPYAPPPPTLVYTEHT